MDFSEDATGTRTATGPRGRTWRIYHVMSGWRLEFHDPGDLTQTRAGLHRSVEAAMAEAASDGRRRPTSPV
jgi:hypothetical protein